MTAALNEMHTDLSKRHGVSPHTSGNLRRHFLARNADDKRHEVFYSSKRQRPLPQTQPKN